MRTLTVMVSLAIVLLLAAPASSSPFQVPADARAIFAQARAAETAGQQDKALDLFWEAHKRSAAVLALDDGGMLDRLLDGLRRRVDDDPEDAPTRYRLAELQAVMGLVGDALSNYTAVAADAEAPEALRRLASQNLPLLRRRSADLASLAETTATTQPSPQVARLSDDNQYLVGRLGDLMEENRRLRSEVADLQDRLTASRKEVDQARAETEKVRQQTKDYKLYYHLFWANPDNYRMLKPGAQYVK